jgi:thioredoxin reductase
VHMHMRRLPHTLCAPTWAGAPTWADACSRLVLGQIEILWNTVAEEAVGDGSLLTGLKIRNVVTKDASLLPINGLFYAIGHVPNTAFLQGKLDLDEDVRCTHTDTHTHTHTDTHTQTDTHTHTKAQVHTRTHPHAPRHKLM